MNVAGSKPSHRKQQIWVCVIAALFVCDFVVCGYLPSRQRLTSLKRARAEQRRTIDMAAAQDVDRAARSVIEKAGFGEYFINRTGHGIGVAVHEAPYIMEGNLQELRKGMAFSVEPGIYIPGRLGIRIEDIVLVTENGAEPLSALPKEVTIA